MGHLGNAKDRRHRAGRLATTTLLALVGLFASLATPTIAPAGAAPITFAVTTTADGGPGSLRAAFAEANLIATAADDVTISIPSGTYSLTACGPGEDANLTGDLDHTSPAALTILGGDGVIVQQTCAGERVIDQLGAGVLTLDNITVSGGTLTSAVPGDAVDGGGIRAAGDVLLVSATVSNNTATGAPPVVATPTGGNVRGGGLFVGGNLDTVDSTIADNVAAASSGSDAVPTNGVGGHGGSAQGGGAYVVGSSSISGGDLTANTATGGNGGASDQTPGFGGAARGGGLAHDHSSGNSAVVMHASITNNVARGGDSGSFLQTPPFPPAVYEPAGDATGGGLVAADTFTLVGTTVAHNQAFGGSAGIGQCLAFSGTCRSPATAGAARGGGVAADNVHVNVASAISSSTLTDNHATSGATFLTFFSQGGTPIGSAGAPATGGAAWGAFDVSSSQSTYTSNSVTQGAGLPSVDGQGAGGALAAGGVVTITDDQLTLNRATTGHGGAIAAGIQLHVTGATFDGNVATGEGGAVSADAVTAEGTTFVRNTGGGSGGGAIRAYQRATLTDSGVTDNVVDAKVYGNNNKAEGGGMLVGGTATLTRVTVAGNTGQAVFTQGILCEQCPMGFNGGGISALDVTGTDVTVAGNTARGPAGAPFGTGGPSGGGIMATGTVTLQNATIANNDLAVTVSDGTVIPTGSAITANTLDLVFATIAENTNGASLSTSTLTTRATAAVPGPGQTVCSSGPTIGAAPASSNVFGDTSCALTDPTDHQGPAAFLLGPLGDNGGPVPTMAPAGASVLIDRVPDVDCVAVPDARGVDRPQGAGCDVGAVELAPVLDVGPADLAVAFTSSPATITPGAPAAWTITVTNKGPSGARPALALTVPATVTNVSAVATGGASCGVSGGTLNCVWTTTIPALGTATVALTGDVDASATAPIALHAEVTATDALPPFTDDVADVSTVVSASANVRMTVQFDRSWDTPGHAQATLFVQLFNDGPSNALGTAGTPIEIELVPAPGVHGTGETVIGSFEPGPDAFHTAFIHITLDPGMTMPAFVGTVVLHPGVTPDPDVTGHQVALAGTDLLVVVSRQGWVQTPGQPTTFTMTVANWGEGTANDVIVSLVPSDIGNVTYTPDVGTVSDTGGIWGPSWQVGSLAPGATAVLRGSVVGQGPSARLDARVSSDAVDAIEENDTTTADLRFAPNGTSDIRVDQVKVYMAAPGQRMLRATIRNHGLAPARANASDPITVMLLTTPEAQGTHAVARAPGWTCSSPDPWWTACTTNRWMARDEVVVIDFAVEGTYPDTQPRLGMSVSAPLTIDGRLRNNTMFVNARYGWPWPPPPLP